MLLKAACRRSAIKGAVETLPYGLGTIKGDPATTSVDYSAAISAAIDQEPAHRTSGLAVFAGSAGRFAIAASVALVAVFGVQQLNSPTGTSCIVAVKSPSLPALKLPLKVRVRRFNFPLAFSQLLMPEQ